MKEIKSHFFWYEEGEPGAKFEKEHAPLGWYLENELHFGTEQCDEILELIKCIKLGEIPECEIPGNENVLQLTPFSAEIKNHHFDPPRVATIPLKKFEKTMVNWNAFLSQRKK